MEDTLPCQRGHSKAPSPTRLSSPELWHTLLLGGCSRQQGNGGHWRSM